MINYVLENSEGTSQRQIAANVGTSPSTVNRVLRDEKIRLWNQLVHELTEEDFDRRLQFAEWILTRSNPFGFAKTIVFSDESIFHLNENVNRHNMSYYWKENEHLTIVRPLKSEAITVWAAVSYYHGLTYVIMDQTVNSERCVQILSTKVAPFLRRNEIYQQDGTPPHFSLLARNLLNEHLHGRWIGRRGFHEWPPRSSDLTAISGCGLTSRKMFTEAGQRHCRKWGFQLRIHWQAYQTTLSKSVILNSCSAVRCVSKKKDVILNTKCNTHIHLFFFQCLSK